MKAIRNAVLGAALVAALPAMAQYYPPNYSPFYIGAGAGSGHLNEDGNSLTGLNNAFLDNSDASYTVRGGWRFNPYMAVELAYYDLGKYSFSGIIPGTTATIQGTAKAKAFGLSFVGILPINTVDLYARVGIANSELKASAHVGNFASADAKDHQNGATYGVGGRWEFVPHWAAFAEWMKNDKIKVDSYLLGIDYKF
jgi:OOP family OmpA-OmpF porin